MKSVKRVTLPREVEMLLESIIDEPEKQQQEPEKQQ